MKKSEYAYDVFFSPQKLRRLEAVRGGRELIMQDVDVRKRTFLDSTTGEAIVVDLTCDTEVYEKYLNEAVERARDTSGRFRRYNILRAVYETVANGMRYSLDGVDAIVASRDNVTSQGINITEFMKEGIGVCRHQAITCALMVETFKMGHFVQGQVSVDTNKRWNLDDESDVSGHAWTRVELRDGRVVILDVAQGYFGTLDDSIDKAGWNYLRPEECEQHSAKVRGKLGIVALRKKLFSA